MQPVWAVAILPIFGYPHGLRELRVNRHSGREARYVMTTPYQRHALRWRGCQQCLLGRQRRRVCLLRGTVPCRVLFIGEAPGASEDVLGKPFVGPAGHLLDSIIHRAGLRPGQYALTNLVACYPRKAKAEGVNEPPPDAVKACRPRVEELRAICQPTLVVAVGKLAAKHQAHDLELIHPAAILRLDVSQKGLAIQRCVVSLANAVEDL